MPMMERVLPRQNRPPFTVAVQDSLGAFSRVKTEKPFQEFGIFPVPHGAHRLVGAVPGASRAGEAIDRELFRHHRNS